MVNWLRHSCFLGNLTHFEITRTQSVAYHNWFDREKSCDTVNTLTGTKVFGWLRQALDSANHMTGLLQIKRNVFTFYYSEVPSKASTILIKEQSTITCRTKLKCLQTDLKKSSGRLNSSFPGSMYKVIVWGMNKIILFFCQLWEGRIESKLCWIPFSFAFCVFWYTLNARWHI